MDSTKSTIADNIIQSLFHFGFICKAGAILNFIFCLLVLNNLGYDSVADLVPGSLDWVHRYLHVVPFYLFVVIFGLFMLVIPMLLGLCAFVQCVMRAVKTLLCKCWTRCVKTPKAHNCWKKTCKTRCLKCSAAKIENCYSATFRLLALLIFLCVFGINTSVGIKSAILLRNKQQLVTLVQMGMAKAEQEYAKNPVTIDTYNQQHNCCWFGNLNSTLPDSCCKNFLLGCGGHSDSSADIMKKSCIYDVITDVTDYLTVVCYWGFTVFGLQMLFAVGGLLINLAQWIESGEKTGDKDTLMSNVQDIEDPTTKSDHKVDAAPASQTTRLLPAPCCGTPCCGAKDASTTMEEQSCEEPEVEFELSTFAKKKLSSETILPAIVLLLPSTAFTKLVSLMVVSSKSAKQKP